MRFLLESGIPRAHLFGGNYRLLILNINIILIIASGDRKYCNQSHMAAQADQGNEVGRSTYYLLEYSTDGSIRRR